MGEKEKTEKLSSQCSLQRIQFKGKGFQPLRISLSISLRIEIFPRNRIDHPRKGWDIQPFSLRLRPSCCSSGIPFNPPWNSSPVQSEMRSNVGSLISEATPSWLVLPRPCAYKRASLAKNGYGTPTERREDEELGREGLAGRVKRFAQTASDGYSILFVANLRVIRCKDPESLQTRSETKNAGNLMEFARDSETARAITCKGYRYLSNIQPLISTFRIVLISAYETSVPVFPFYSIKTYRLRTSSDNATNLI